MSIDANEGLVALERGPLVLLADSQLLFFADDRGPFLSRVRAMLADPSAPRAAYVGAPNGDAPEFYEIFVAAMEGAGVRNCRAIPSEPSAEDEAFLDGADLVLIAGGDPACGMAVFERTGLGARITRRHERGAVVLGVSAGAMLLGTRTWAEADSNRRIPALGLAPFLVEAHGEPDWDALAAAVLSDPTGARGIGIPAGGRRHSRRRWHARAGATRADRSESGARRAPHRALVSLAARAPTPQGSNIRSCQSSSVTELAPPRATRRATAFRSGRRPPEWARLVAGDPAHPDVAAAPSSTGSADAARRRRSE